MELRRLGNSGLKVSSLCLGAMMFGDRTDAREASPIAAQPCYNAVTRLAEADYLPACAHYGIGVVPYSPLARGVLTAKYTPGQNPAKGTRAGRNDPRLMQTEWREPSLVIAQKIAKRAAKRGMSAADFAMAWVLHNPLISSVIAGPRTVEQWQAYIDALGHTLDADDEAFIDKLVPPGCASDPTYRDPQDSVEGRPVGATKAH